jgi:ATP-dependent Clp protease protease subunit
MDTTPFVDLPVCMDRNRAMPDDDMPIRKWASSDGSGDVAAMDWKKYAKAFFAVDEANAESTQGYSLMFADVVDGDLQALSHGVMACGDAMMQMMMSNGMMAKQTAPDMTPDEADAVKKHVAKYYEKMSKAYGDPKMVPPWEKDDEQDRVPLRVAASGRTQSVAAKFWDVRASADGGEADIYIYGDIEQYPWFDTDVSADSFRRDLEAVGPVSVINVYINSLGGSVWQGQAIYSQLKRHPATVNVHVDGIAASAASFIAMAGDNVFMPENAMLMLHNPMCMLDIWCYANAAEIRERIAEIEKTAIMLDKARIPMIAAYRMKSGLTEARIGEMLDNETWLTAAEAVELGLADETTPAKQVAASASSLLSTYRKVPAALKAALAKGVVPEGADNAVDRAAELAEARKQAEEVAAIRATI